jgi:sulfide:quinone oxidoreductase
MSPAEPLEVLIAGGGIAAAELALGLADLAGERVSTTIVSPGQDLVMRPFHPGEAFSVHSRSHYPLAALAEHTGAAHLRGKVEAVDGAAQRVQVEGSGPVSYDVLALTLGARSVNPYRQAMTFRGDRAAIPFASLLSDIEQGYTTSVGFVVPPGMNWPLPLYELALLTAREARSMGVEPDLALITPEHRPLAVFGPAGSAAVADLLEHAGISFAGEIEVDESEPGVFTTAGGRPLDAQRVVTVPVLEGIALPGVPVDPHGFIPIDDHCRVRGLEHVFAAGDGTTNPVKQGGIACQQADVIAEQIAQMAGADVTPRPVRPVLRGRLMTGRAVRYISDHDPTGGEAEQPMLFAAHRKVDGRYLSPWIAEMDGASAAPGEPVPEARSDAEVAVEVEVPSAP